MKWIGFIHEFLFLHGASHLIFSSKTAIDYFKPFYIQQKSTSIINPAPQVLPDQTISIRERAKYLLFVGQVKHWKGLDVLLKSLTILKNMDLHLDIAGIYDTGSEYYKMINDIIMKNSLQKTVRFHGHLTKHDLSTLYRRADIFIMPSRYETYGIVLLEAMSFGLPIISSSIPSAKVIVKDGINGLFYDTENPKDLAKAIRFLSTNKNLRAKMYENNLRARTAFRTWTDVSEEMFHHISKFL